VGIALGLRVYKHLFRLWTLTPYTYQKTFFLKGVHIQVDDLPKESGGDGMFLLRRWVQGNSRLGRLQNGTKMLT